MRGRGPLVLATSALLAGCASTDVACTQQYGHRRTADVVGRWAGKPADRVPSRTDGCRIAQ